MVSPISGNYGASPAWGNMSGATNIDNLGAFNFNKFAPVKSRNAEAQQTQKGPQIQLHELPAVFQWLAQEIKKKFRINVYNSDIPFTEDELKIMLATLETIPPEHLIGVKTLVKNKKLQLSIENQYETIFAKRYQSRAYGAYDKENKRIYIFELDNPAQAVTVLKHEIGHAVHSHNMSFPDFFRFSLKAGWNVAFHEQRFIPNNELYNIGMTKVILAKKEAIETLNHFDWDSIKDNKDKLGKYLLFPPEDKKDNYAFKNPFETFATFYEKIV